MNHQQPANINIKVSLVATNENRFIALPSPPSFNLLVEKITTAFNLSTDKVAVRVHYLDDESDRVTISSNDELACALSLPTTGGRALRLFVSTAPCAALQPAAAQPIREVETQPTRIPPTGATASDVDQDQPNDVDATQDLAVVNTNGEVEAIDTLKRRLEQEAGIVIGVNVCEKRCLRVLARFGGDLDKALAALARFHERKQLRLQAGNDNKNPPRTDPAKPEALQQQREARRAERLAAKLVRQEQKQLRQASTDSNDAESAIKKKVDAASVEALMALMTELSLAVGRGRCTGALRRADGDIETAKADLVAWCAKRQEHKRNKTISEPIDHAEKEKLMGQLDEMGFGPSSFADDKGNIRAADRIKRRNERLLNRFNGDVAQVAALLEARKAKVEARLAARKANQGQRPRSKRTTQELGATAPTTAC